MGNNWQDRLVNAERSAFDTVDYVYNSANKLSEKYSEGKISLERAESILEGLQEDLNNAYNAYESVLNECSDLLNQYELNEAQLGREFDEELKIYGKAIKKVLTAYKIPVAVSINRRIDENCVYLAKISNPKSMEGKNVSKLAAEIKRVAQNEFGLKSKLGTLFIENNESATKYSIGIELRTSVMANEDTFSHHVISESIYNEGLSEFIEKRVEKRTDKNYDKIFKAELKRNTDIVRKALNKFDAKDVTVYTAPEVKNKDYKIATFKLDNKEKLEKIGKYINKKADSVFNFKTLFGGRQTAHTDAFALDIREDGDGYAVIAHFNEAYLRYLSRFQAENPGASISYNRKTGTFRATRVYYY